VSTFFTSDTHFLHGNIIKYCNRPFDSIAEHDQTLIDNWNSVVNSKDTVYHLGDFGATQRASTETIDRLQKICGKLKGNIILIKGNHDTNINKVKRFNIVKDYHVVSVHNHRFVLFHYPMRSWQFANHGSIHLFGHCHSNMMPHYKSFDIGVDFVARYILGTPDSPKKENYRPLSAYEVLDYAKTLSQPQYKI